MSAVVASHSDSYFLPLDDAGLLVRDGEAVVGGQHGLAIAAAEMNRAGVACGNVAVRVERRDRETESDTGGGRGGQIGYAQVHSGRRGDGDQLRRSDGRGRRVVYGQRLGAGGAEGDAEAVLSVVGQPRETAAAPTAP